MEIKIHGQFSMWDDTTICGLPSEGQICVNLAADRSIPDAITCEDCK